MFTFTALARHERRFDGVWPASGDCIAGAGTTHARVAELLCAGARMANRRREIRRVLIVLNVRPAFAEIVDYRRITEEVGVDMSVDGTGTVTIRRRSGDERAREPGEGRFGKGMGT